MRRALKWIGWIVAVLIGLPLALLVAVLVFANTDPGRGFIERLVPKVTGGEVAITGLSGRFPDALRLAHVEVRDKDGTWLTIEDLAVDWRPLRLLAREADFQRIAAERVAVARQPASAAATPAKPGSSTSSGLPVAVNVETLHVGRLEVAAPVAGTPASVSADGSAHLASLEQGDVTLALRRLDGPGNYDLNGRITPAALQVQLTAEEPAHGLISAVAGLPELGPLSIHAALDGPRDAVGTKLSVDAGPLRARADGTLDLVHQAADLTVSANAPAMSPRPDLSWQSVALNARVQGPFAKPEAAGTLNIDALSAAGAGISRLAAQVQGDAGAVKLHAEADEVRVPGPRPDLLAAAPLVIDAAVRLDALDRPATFAINHPLISAEGKAQTAGTVRAEMTLDLPDLAPFAAAGGADIRGHTALTLNATQADGATTVKADGTVAITGGMAPLPALIGDAAKLGVTAAMRGQDVTLSRLQLDGKTLAVAADGGMSGNAVDLNWKVALSDLHALASTVAGRLSAQGHVAGPQDDLSVTADLAGEVATQGMPRGPLKARLEAQHLPNAPTGKLTAEGTLEGAPLTLAVAVQQDAAGAMHLDIDRADWKSAHANGALTLPKGAMLPVGKLDLRMARLDDLRALTGQALAGSVSATLETTEQGGRQTARLQAEARNAGLAGTASVGRATLNATVADPTAKPVVDAKLAVDDVAASGIRGNAKLDVAGPQDALSLRLSAAVQNLQGAPLTLTSAATLNATRKETTLSAMQANWKGETLRLLAPARIGFGNAITVDRLALGMRQATVEVAGRASPTLDLTVAVRNVTPDLAKIVDPNISADGTLRADAKLTGTTARPVGTIRVEAAGLRMRTGPGRSLPPANLTATADLAGDSARIDTRLSAGRLTTLTVTGRAPLQPAAGGLDLRANGSLDLAMLDPILAANGRRVRGQVTLNLGVAGSLSAPRVTGTVQLAGGEVQDFAQGAHVTTMTALIQAEGDTIRIVRFTGRAGQGTVSLTGTVGVTAPGMPVDLHLVADNAKPLASDRLQVTLSADLTVRGEAAGQLQAAGTIRIARAEIHIPEHMPASVAVLNVRNIGTPPPPPPAPGPDVTLNLTISAPREIFVRGRGVFAELGGEIHVRGTAAKPIPDGSFQMIRGTLSIAGQSLTFSKGEVSFSGGGLTDPSIDFVATSSTSTISANLEVSGYASDPKIRLYSTPELPQDEVLAWLIFKRSSSSLSPFELAQIAAALAQLTGVGGGFSDPLEAIRKGLGLDTLSVGGGSGNSGPALQAGRYVAPGVFVGARQGTSGTSTQGLVQVDITKGLKLEGTVGTGSNTNPGATPEDSGGSSLGLKYQFEY